MRYSVVSLEHNHETGNPLAVSPSIHRFLMQCDKEVFDAWHKSFPNVKQVSIANALGKTVFPSLTHLVADNQSVESPGCFVKFAFAHRSYTGGIFLDILREARKSGWRCLVVTQSDGFKRKFRYNSSTMTIDSIREDFLEFAGFVNPRFMPQITFIVFEDMDLDVSVFTLRGHRIINLEVPGDS